VVGVVVVVEVLVDVLVVEVFVEILVVEVLVVDASVVDAAVVGTLAWVIGASESVDELAAVDTGAAVSGVKTSAGAMVVAPRVGAAVLEVVVGEGGRVFNLPRASVWRLVAALVALTAR
jgi:hypothetical protein